MALDSLDRMDDVEENEAKAPPKPVFDPSALPGDNPVAQSKKPAEDIAEQGSNEVVDREVDAEVDQGGLGNEPSDLGNDPLSK